MHPAQVLHQLPNGPVRAGRAPGRTAAPVRPRPRSGSASVSSGGRPVRQRAGIRASASVSRRRGSGGSGRDRALAPRGRPSAHASALERGPILSRRAHSRHRLRRPRTCPAPGAAPRPRRRRAAHRPGQRRYRRAGDRASGGCRRPGGHRRPRRAVRPDLVVDRAGGAAGQRRRRRSCARGAFAVFGPSAAAARIEGSKAFAKDVMAAAGVPTARRRQRHLGGRDRRRVDPLRLAVRGQGRRPRGRQGRGGHRGPGGRRRPRAWRSWTAGTRCWSRSSWPVPRCRCSRCATAPSPCRCCRRRTSSGSVTATPGRTPAAWAPMRRCRGRRPGWSTLVQRPVLDPVLAEMARRGTPFAGLLYAGSGAHRGRAEGHRVQLPVRRPGDPGGAGTAGHPAGCAAGRGRRRRRWARSAPLTWRGAAAVTVVIAAENYPGTPVTGDVITGADGDGILHAGTKIAADGSVVSAGGRVLSAVATGGDLAAARENAYALVEAGAPARLAPPDRYRAGRRRGPGAASPAPPDAADDRAVIRSDAPAPGRLHPSARSRGRAVLRHAGARRRRPRAPNAATPSVQSGRRSTLHRRPGAGAAPPRTLTLDSHILGYTEAPGIAPLREAIAGHYRDRYDLDVDADRRGRHHRIVRRFPAGLPGRVRRRQPGRRWPAPATRPTGTSCTPWAVRSSTCRAGRRPAINRRCR